MMQNNYKTRWIVIEYYYGKFNDNRHKYDKHLQYFQ